MPKDDNLYLGHMLDSARKACDKIRGVDRASFDADENLRLSLVYLVQIIGEAARRVSLETCSAHPEIPWREIIGMRHKIVHEYMSIDEDIVWVVVNQDLPALVEALSRIMQE